MSRRNPRVALLVPTASQWGRGVIEGIHNYVRKHGPWQLFVDAASDREQLSLPPGWDGDGVIARVNSAGMAKDLESSGLPIVNVSRIRIRGHHFPRVITDLSAVVEIAVQHFLDRGFHSFAYFSQLGAAYVSDHRRAFVATVKQHGFRCPVFATYDHKKASAKGSDHREAMAAWLADLPKPVGIFTWNASSSQQLLQGIDWAGFKVPEEISVLSGLDDDLLCELASVPLSGIAAAAQTIGHQAAQTLHQLLRGKRAPKAPKLVAPLGVVARRSTDTLAIRDPDLAAAVRFIREHASEPISVQDVLNHVPVSRRSLERKFVQLLNRTPAEEIRQVHFERAKHFLEHTDLSEPDVAAASGYGSPEYMVYVFGKRMGESPMQYRKRIRSR